MVAPTAFSAHTGGLTPLSASANTGSQMIERHCHSTAATQVTEPSLKASVIGDRSLKLQQVFTLGRLRPVYDHASPLYALAWWWPDTMLDPGLEQFKGFVSMGLDQFQAGELFSDRGASKGI